MFKEVQRYRPENIRPRDFLRPPTEPFQEQVIQLCLGLESQINAQAAKLVGLPGLRRLRRRITPGLRMGTEFELILFAPNANPPVDKKQSRSANPNYEHDHVMKVKSVRNRIVETPRYGGLSDILEPMVSSLSGISLEIRTLPGTVTEYVQAVQRIQEWFQEHGEKDGFNPAVSSQHIHFSLFGKSGEYNILKRKKFFRRVADGVVDTYHRAAHLMRLPEDLDTPQVESFGYGTGYGVQRKGGNNQNSRLEGRYNSHGYAADPYLNLLINLIGIYRGVVAARKIRSTKFDGDYPLHGNDSERKRRKYHNDFRFAFDTGRDALTYHEALGHFMRDDVLKTFMPEDLRSGLFEVVSHYKSISHGLVDAPKVRAAAEPKPGSRS